MSVSEVLSSPEDALKGRNPDREYTKTYIYNEFNSGPKTQEKFIILHLRNKYLTYLNTLISFGY